MSAAADSPAPDRPTAGPRRTPWSAVLYALGAIIMFVVMAVCIRALSSRVSAGDITFYRTFFGLLLMLPFLLGRGPAYARSLLATRRLGLFTLRAVLTYTAVISYFYAVTKIPLAEAIALNSTLPIFMTAMAAAMLGERVGLQRWLAVALGFGGALVILRPGFAEVSWPALASFASAALYAAAAIDVKILARTEPPARIVFYMNLLVTVLAAGPFLVDFTPPLWSDFPYILAIGAAGTLAHLFQSNALKRADASFVAPFDFLRLPLAAIAGFALFHDQPGLWVWAGAALIFASAFWIARREAVRKRQTQPSS
jgi:drug/metabolite transporter (DMT)-like permease